LGDRRNAIYRSPCAGVRVTRASAALLFLCAAFLARTTRAQAPPLPNAPQPKKLALSTWPAAGACQIRIQGGALAATAAAKAVSVAGYGPLDAQLSRQPLPPVPCPIYLPLVNWYARFLNGPQVKPLTSKEKAWLAVRNIGDPFNAITILGTSAISVASDPDSPYGPGMPGFARNVGVSYTQDITSEFFNTFLVSSLTHEDPHYHREPTRSIRHRIVHCLVQVLWTQGDNGRGMINYDDLVGFAIDDEIDNLYVPGRATNVPSSATRWAINLALVPTDNAITEFVPDIASKIHVHAVFVQRIIDQVAKANGGASP
jgi:hypothetical protein